VIIKKFYADTAGEALRLVRKALGAEALILGNRRTAGGVEIMAVAPSEFESVTVGVTPEAHARGVSRRQAWRRPRLIPYLG